MHCAALFVGCAYAYAALTLAHLTASVLVLGGIVVSVVGGASFAVALCWKVTTKGGKGNAALKHPKV